MTKFVAITYHPTIMRYDEIEKFFYRFYIGINSIIQIHAQIIMMLKLIQFIILFFECFF